VFGGHYINNTCIFFIYVINDNTLSTVVLILGQQNLAEIIVVINLNCTKAASLAVVRAPYVASVKCTRNEAM
jgi:hypothetical protein